MKQTKRIFVLSLLAILTLSSCASKMINKANLDQISLRTWKLNLLNGNPVVSEEPVTMTFDLRESSINGRAHCNMYGGELDTTQIDNGIIGITNIISTRRACPDLSGEQEFFETLQQVKALSLKDGKLLLLTEPKSTTPLMELSPILP